MEIKQLPAKKRNDQHGNTVERRFIMEDNQELTQGGINLADLMFFCLERWRWILACMLVTAVVLGAYKYQATVKANRSSENKEIIQEDVQDEVLEIQEDDQAEFVDEQSYEQAIQEMEHDLEIQKNYLDHSVVMQLDPYHVSTGTLSYYVESGEHTDGVVAAYNTFVSSGKMAEELYSMNDGIPVEDLRYLITFHDSKSEKFEIKDNTMASKVKDAVFQLQIRMPEDVSGDAYLRRAEEIMLEFASHLRSELEEHKLVLLASVQSEATDLDMQEYQSAIRSTYIASVKNLQSLRTEFATLHSSQSSNAEMQHVEQTQPVLANPFSAAVKFGLFGLVVGFCVSCFVLLLLYMLGGKLQDIDVFASEYSMPMLGVIRLSENQKRLFGFIDTWIFRLRGGYYSQISFLEQVKIASANIQTAITKHSDVSDCTLKKIMVAGTIAEKDISVLCVQLASEMREVSLSPYMQIVFQSSALEELEKYDGILFIEKKGTSDSKLIIQERKLALDRDVKVLGTIVVC